jgi:sodium transport system permease protein
MSGTAELGPSLVAVAATMLYAALALGFAARSFGREEVLFGTGAGNAKARGRHAWASTANRIPTPGEALIFVGAVAVIFFLGARPLALAHGETGLVLAQVFFLAAPALLFVLLGRFTAAGTLAIRMPSSRALGAGFLIILGGIPIGWLVAWLQGFVLEIPYELLEALQQMVMAQDRNRLLWLLFLVALTPAICEELVFRGVLLGSLRGRLGMIQSIVGSAFVFGAFHLSFETAIRFLPTFWLGLLLAYVTWHTRSIFPAMLMHFVNNAVVVLLVSTPALRQMFADPAGQPPWLLVLAGPFLLVLGVRMLRSSGASTAPGDRHVPTLPEDAVPAAGGRT